MSSDIASAIGGRANQIAQPSIATPTHGQLSNAWRQRHFLLLVSDALAIVLAVMLSYFVRFMLEGFSLKPVEPPDITLYLKSAILLLLFWIYGLFREGAYERGLRGVSSPGIRVRLLIKTGAYSLGALMVVGFMYRDLLLSRQVYVMTALISLAIMTGTRQLFYQLDHLLAARGYVTAKVAIIGINASVSDFAETLQRETRGSIRVLGFIRTPSDHDAGTGTERILGSIEDIENIYRAFQFDKLVMAAHRSDDSPLNLFHLLNFCEANNVALYVIPGSFDVAISPSEIASLSGTPLIRLKDASLHPLYSMVKRLFDVVAATTILLIGLPLWVAIVGMIKLSGPGPIFFSQWRAGHHGKPFRMHKFRSMSNNAEHDLKQLVDLAQLKEPVFKIKNDPRVTPMGRLLRGSGLDEIPQLFNVIKGEMSLVGPRPEEMGLVDRYDSWQRRRLKAKPGITGYQQIMNRGGNSLAERVKYDLIYLKHQSFALDLYILFKTPIVLLKGEGTSH